ncbi:hypothetical protein Hypma_001996 [Hypsizygus marmoreus]|uniref:F-box domain-containing protein n=1 Tax=Hypsizygus marmoreus TaxID=39966 RepID=A0A369JA83_HYPMA|nr:hypothetical protein Hypma_001996 [Hypsizygus marmoreus]
MSVSSPVLPQELLDKVIDDLQDDFEALKVCTLTSRSLLGRSQINLFFAIRISNLQRCRRLRSVLEGNPLLSERVRELEVVDFIKWVKGDTDLPYILRATVLLRSLCVESSEDPLLWPMVPKDTVDALTSAFCRPTLCNLRMSMIRDFPVHLLGLEMNLAHLSLREVVLNPGTLDTTGHVDFSRTSAHTVEVCLDMPFLSDLAPYQAVAAKPCSFTSRIRNLVIHNTGMTMFLAVPFVESAAGSLETIQLRERPSVNLERPRWFKYDFSTLRYLRRLELHFMLGFHSRNEFRHLTSVALRRMIDFFVDNRSATRVKQINVRFIPWWNPSWQAPESQWVLDILDIKNSWSELDRILDAGRGSGESAGFRVGIELGLPILDKQEFIYGPVDEWRGGIEEKMDVWREMIHTLMPLASGAGVLVTDVIADVDSR